MPKYRVFLEELASYEVVVEAENEEAAGEQAEWKFIDGDVKDFPVEVHEREVAKVEIIEETEEGEDK